ncbi:MAG: NADH-ubiquinone oxidoreductase-F iron-sulfur binding region domain-containing protein [Thermodesulfobacteriota bacterium]|nr:NADH-ubiquinone oxidoreductase-F iron-sulfur binding region domain-containing protein [Thermodesulfobacteriota bacterium]
MKLKKADDLTKIKKEGTKLLAPAKTRITVGMATCGLAKGAGKVYEALKYELKKQKVKADLVVVGCNGLCYAEPIVEVIRSGKPRVTYGNVGMEQVNELVSSIKSGAVLKDLAVMRHDKFKTAVGNESIAYTKGKPAKAYSGIKEAQRIDFYKRQMKLVSSGAGTISPDSIEEYCALGGYQALANALTGMDPEAVIKEVSVSKLRGRGGAGFPTGIKWRTCRQAEDDTKYIVCNGSEGDPEIGMHRSFLESDPHLIIEGMVIAGYAVGAQEGYIYLNDKYTIALERLEGAIAQAEKRGLLGKNILGSGFSFAVKIKRGGGAYVCGEETALLNALEGSFGEPRPRPPYPAEKGLFGKPTVVNNLETLATIPVIIKKGGKWYAGIGSSSSKGTKIVALSGNVSQTCWVEVPLGTGIKDVIDTFGKGAANGKKIKAFQAGGPSGGILPAKSLKMKLDYDQLSKAGSLLGSGGLLVMDEDTDMLDMAKFFVDFFVDESCGKCSTCREGCKRLQDILEGIMEGQGTADHIKLIKRLDSAMSVASACALGKTAAVPIISVLKHFPKEIEGRLIRRKA